MGNGASTTGATIARDEAKGMEKENNDVVDVPDCKAPPGPPPGQPPPAAIAAQKNNDAVAKHGVKADKGEHKKKADEFKAQGNQAFADGDDAKAAEFYSQAIALDPKNHVLYSNRSGALLRDGKAAEALADALRCVDCCVGWAKGYNRKGAALHTLGRLQDAAAAYKEGLAIAPANAPLKDALKLVDGLIATEAKRKARAAALQQKKDSTLTTGGKERKRVVGRVRTVGQQGTPPEKPRQRQPQPRRSSAAARAPRRPSAPKDPKAKGAKDASAFARAHQVKGGGSGGGVKVSVRKRVSIPSTGGGEAGDGGTLKPKRPPRRLPKASSKRGEVSRAEKVKSASPTKGGKDTNAAAAAAPTLVAGAKVRVHGLKGKINGTEGVAQQWNASKGKWMVKLDGRNRALPISEANLENAK